MSDKSNNKTGAELKPAEVAAMEAASKEFSPTSTGSKFGADGVRIDYARSVDEKDLGYGSVPGPEPKQLFDLLGERLAFERTGVRLYQSMISKLEAFGRHQGGPTREELLEILNEEHSHLMLLQDAIAQLDGDPTAMTPAADVAGNLAQGVIQVVTDPRTTVVQCLEATLVAELADGAGWRGLIEVTRRAGYEDLAKRFEEAEQAEEKHRAKVESWLLAARVG
ncbi:MAG: ferritin-like domain-containing protein [Enhygromyxa sp.]